MGSHLPVMKRFAVSVTLVALGAAILIVGLFTRTWIAILIGALLVLVFGLTVSAERGDVRVWPFRVGWGPRAHEAEHAREEDLPPDHHP
jgi:hypothetical protein